MLNRKRIFAIVLFVLIGLFVYTFANPAEDLEPLDNNNNIEDVDKDKDDDKKDDVIQLPDEDDNNLVPVIVNAANYDVLRTAVANGNVVLNLETEDEGLNSLLDQLETATNNGQQIITNQINDQNLVNNGANAINALVTRINALLSENLEDAIEEGNRILNYYAEISNLNPNLQGLLNDLDDAIEGASDLESPDLQQILQDTIEILEIIIEIEEFQADLDIINSMSLRLVPNITNWTNKNIILTAEYDIENPDLIEDINIVNGSTCTVEEPLPMFSRIFEDIVMDVINNKEKTVSENGDYTACITFNNGELRSATYTVENIDKEKPTLKLDTENSATYRPEHRRVAQVSDSGGSSLEKSVYAWVRLENINTFDITDLSTENGFKPVINNQNLYTPAGATGSYKLIMVAADVAGNVTEYTSKATFNLDNTGPSIDFDVNDVNISEPAQSHSVKVKVEDSETSIRYVKYQWTKTNEEPSFDSFADEPTVTLTEGVFSNPIVTLPDENGNWYLWILAVNNSVMYSESDLATYNYQCKITSVDGKCTIYSINGMGEFALDNEGPTKPEVSISGVAGQWTNQNISVGLSSTDAHSGDVRYEWATSPNATDEHWRSAKNPYAISWNLNSIIYFRAVDKLGNKSVVSDPVSFKIDKFKAEVSFKENTITEYTKDLEVIVKVDDATNATNKISSEINNVKYLWVSSTSEEEIKEESFAEALTLALNANGEGRVINSTDAGTFYLYVYVKDNAGNVTIAKSGLYDIDNLGPTKPELNITGVAGQWTNQNISVGLSSTDAHSGDVRYEWATSPNATDEHWRSAKNPYAISWNLNSIIYFRAVDKLGNKSVVSDPVSFKIDKFKAEVSFNENTITEYTKDLEVIVKVDDATNATNKISSEINNVKYLWVSSTSEEEITEENFVVASSLMLNANGEGRVINSTDTGTFYLYVYVKDNAGNVTIAKSGLYNIDNTAPVPTVRYTEITKENGESYDLLTGVSSDDSEATIVATVNGVEVTNSNQLSVGTHTINYTFTDAVGNYATATATITVKVDFTIELLPSGFLVSRRIAFTYWLGGYTINNVNLITPEGDELTLGNVETMWDLIYGRQRVVLTKDQYNQLDSGTYSIKVTYKNNWLNLDNLVMYYTFQ